MKLFNVEARGRFTVKAKVYSPTAEDAVKCVQERLAASISDFVSVSLVDARARVLTSTWVVAEVQAFGAARILSFTWDLGPTIGVINTHA